MPITIRLHVRVNLRARSSVLRRRVDGSLTARVTEPPINGRANRALVNLPAKILDLPRRDISIERGTRGRDKRIAVTADNPSAVQAAVRRREATG